MFFFMSVDHLYVPSFGGTPSLLRKTQSEQTKMVYNTNRGCYSELKAETKRKKPNLYASIQRTGQQILVPAKNRHNGTCMSL